MAAAGGSRPEIRPGPEPLGTVVELVPADAAAPTGTHACRPLHAARLQPCSRVGREGGRRSIPRPGAVGAGAGVRRHDPFRRPGRSGRHRGQLPALAIRTSRTRAGRTRPPHQASGRAREAHPFEQGSLSLPPGGRMVIARARHEPGWIWREHAHAGDAKQSCDIDPVGMVERGVMTVGMADRQEPPMRPRDVFAFGAGHVARALETSQPADCASWSPDRTRPAARWRVHAPHPTRRTGSDRFPPADGPGLAQSADTSSSCPVAQL